MSLIGALNLGKSALTAHQAALQVTGNNIANAGNADYTRQSARLTPGSSQQVSQGVFIGTGVNLSSVTRQIDEALQSRLRSAGSDSAGADTLQQWLGRVEATFNELSDQDLSTQMSTFFNSWSALANKPTDVGLRQIVINNGQSLAGSIKSLRGSLSDLQNDVDSRVTALSSDANRLAQSVADLNQQVTLAEGGSGGEASTLRDQRDAALKQLSDLIDIKTVPGANGITNVYVGSEPLVQGTTNLGIGTKQDSVNGQVVTRLVFKNNGATMNVTGGQLGALMQVKTDYLAPTLNQVDTIASNLIFELNKVHSSGQGMEGFTSVTATNAVADPAASLATDAALTFKPSNGGFVVHVTDKTTGQMTSTTINVKIGVAGTTDTTLNSLASQIDGIAGISASIVGGRLKVQSDGSNPNVAISFGEDTSGALAALGVNTFFTGSNARDIGINAVVTGNPSMLNASSAGIGGGNGTAQKLAGLESTEIASLGGNSLKATYQAMVNGVAVQASAAGTNAEAAAAVKQTLEGQREALSGVSMDEEAVNLMREQRAFQGAARLIAAVDEMMKTILQLA